MRRPDLHERNPHEPQPGVAIRCSSDNPGLAAHTILQDRGVALPRRARPHTSADRGGALLARPDPVALREVQHKDHTVADVSCARAFDDRFPGPLQEIVVYRDLEANLLPELTSKSAPR